MQTLSFEQCKIFKNTLFHETFTMAASAIFFSIKWMFVIRNIQFSGRQQWIIDKEWIYLNKSIY